MKKVISVMIAFVIIIFSIYPVNAAENSGITITGEYSDKLSFVVDNDYIFQKSMVAPDDTWTSEIKIRNTSSDVPLEVRLVNIESLIEDLRLYNELSLVLRDKNNNVFYQGAYNKGQSPIIPWFTISAGNQVVIYADVTFNSDASNALQKSKMLSRWNFECRVDVPDKTQPSGSSYPGGSNDPSAGSSDPGGSIDTSDRIDYNNPIQTGVQYAMDNPWVIPVFFVSSALLGFLTFYALHKIIEKKKKRKGESK